MAETFPQLSTAELETLLAALDPQHWDPGSLADSLADPPAFLARIGLEAGPVALVAWLERWRAAGGVNRHCAWPFRLYWISGAMRVQLTPSNSCGRAPMREQVRSPAISRC